MHHLNINMCTREEKSETLWHFNLDCICKRHHNELRGLKLWKTDFAVCKNHLHVKKEATLCNHAFFIFPSSAAWSLGSSYTSGQSLKMHTLYKLKHHKDLYDLYTDTRLCAHTHKHAYCIFTQPSRVCWTTQLTHKTPAYRFCGPSGPAVSQSFPRLLW